MIRSVCLPAPAGQRYWEPHYAYFESTARAAELVLERKPMPEVGNTFDAEVNGRRVIVDFSDHTAIRPKRGQEPYFKFHYSEKIHGDKKRVYPIGPVSFLDWDQFFRLRRGIRYEARGDTVVNCQAPGGDALERRRQVRDLLRETYGPLADTTLTDQETFWRKADSLISVFVPGARIDILDRGQLQFMAFGACTISPRLDITLPFMRQLQAGVHYLACKPDFSDLIETIEWARRHRVSCREIGKNAAELFAVTSLPWKLWGWISDVLEKA